MRTDVSWSRNDGSYRAEALVHVRLVLFGKPVKRSAVQVVPGRLHAELVVVRDVRMHLLEHDRHTRLLALQARRLRRRTCNTPTAVERACKKT